MESGLRFRDRDGEEPTERIIRVAPLSDQESDINPKARWVCSPFRKSRWGHKSFYMTPKPSAGYHDKLIQKQFFLDLAFKLSKSLSFPPLLTPKRIAVLDPPLFVQTKRKYFRRTAKRRLRVTYSPTTWTEVEAETLKSRKNNELGSSLFFLHFIWILL